MKPRLFAVARPCRRRFRPKLKEIYLVYKGLFFKLLRLRFNQMPNNPSGYFYLSVTPVIIRLFFVLSLSLHTSFIKAQTAESPLTQVQLNLHLADSLIDKDWEKSVTYAKEALAIATNSGIDSLFFKTNLMLSKSYLGLGDYANALTYGAAALPLASDTISRANALHQLGRVYESRAEYQKSMKYFLEAIRLYKSVDNKNGIANTYNSLAYVYKEMDQHQKALEGLKEAKSIYEAIGNRKKSAAVTFTMGLMIMEMDQYAEAIPYFRKAMSGLTEAAEPKRFSSFYNNLANCYQKLRDRHPSYLDSALYYGKKNLALKKQIKDYRGIANAHNGLAFTYELKNDFVHSYEHSITALKISDSLNHKKIKENALKYLITAEVNLKKLDKVSDHFEELLDVTEELNKESSSRALNEMSTRFETEKKESENQRLLLVNTQQQKLNQVLLGSGAILLIAFGFLVNFYRSKQKVNAQLQKQKTQIESSLREKESLLREIHHRVKNNLQVISSLLNMQSYYLDDPRMINAIAEGQNRVKAMALIHQKLYQTEHLSEIDFQEYTEQLISHLSAAFGEQGKMIQSKVNGSALKLDIDTAIPLGLILNELITNSYKYAFSGVNEGSFKVDLTRDDSAYYHLRISDSGPGLPADFDEEKLNSLGLKLVHMLIEQLDGSLTISNEGGANFYIRFKESKLSA